MGFVAAKCPNCGATIELSEDREFGFCTYCGTKVVQDKIVVEHRGSVSVSGIANEEAIISRAFLFIEDKKFQNANAYLERALDINPRSYKAYLGKLLCAYQLPNVDSLKSSFLAIDDNEYYAKALRFASAAELSELKSIKEQIDHNREGLKSHIASNKRKIVFYQISNIILLLVFIILAVFAAILLLLTLFLGAEKPSIILIIIVVIAIIQTVISFIRRKLKKRIIEHDSLKHIIS